MNGPIKNQRLMPDPRTIERGDRRIRSQTSPRPQTPPVAPFWDQLYCPNASVHTAECLMYMFTYRFRRSHKVDGRPKCIRHSLFSASRSDAFWANMARQALFCV